MHGRVLGQASSGFGDSSAGRYGTTAGPGLHVGDDCISARSSDMTGSE